MRKFLTAIVAAITVSACAGQMQETSDVSSSVSVAAGAVTLSLAVMPPNAENVVNHIGIASPQFQRAEFGTFGLGDQNAIHIPINAVPVGATITQASMNVFPTNGGCFFGFYDQTNGHFGPGRLEGEASAFSVGAPVDTWSSISFAGDVSFVVQKRHSYSLVAYTSGFGPCFISAADVTYTPAL